jgi:putative transposase
VVLYGRLPVSRSAIPELLADLARWPGVDRSALPEDRRHDFDQRVEAVRLFVEEKDVTLTAIARRTRVQREQLYRLLQRCMSKHADGRIYGFRGLLPHQHLKEYERHAAVKATVPRGRGGSAGAMSQLLRRLPALERWLTQAARKRNRPLREGEFREVRPSLHRMHRQFLDKCRELGVRDHEWPFNRDGLGFRSFQSFVYGVKASRGRAEPEEEEAAPAVEAPTTELDDEMPPALMPFDAVQFDGHKIDMRLTLKFIDPFGMEALFEITRIWILVCLDVVTRAVLGYCIAASSEYDNDDVARALQSCFGPRQAPKLTIPALSIREGGGFPSDLFERARYPGWKWFQYDNARANLAEATLRRLSDIVGCYVHAGRLGEPNDRAFIERFFAVVARSGLHQLPGSTGSSVDDIVRSLADLGPDLQLRMTVEELCQVIEVMLGDYNGESHGGLGGRTPLEAMRYWLEKPGVHVRQLPAPKRRQMMFLQEAVLKRVRGSGGPHVNFEGVRYSSDILRANPHLVGKQIRVYFNTQDIRQLHAFFEDGAELGILVAARSWRRTAHSLRQRKEILRLVRLGKLRYRPDEDAIEAYSLYKRRQARTKKTAATALAELQMTIQQAQALEAPPAAGGPQRPSEPRAQPPALCAPTEL